MNSCLKEREQEEGQEVEILEAVNINTEFVPLRGGRLASFQELWRGVYFVIIDEKSMLGLCWLKLTPDFDSSF